jgi:2-dehydro-3-deoxyphosphogluconate aldolase/(4S)-4-hydroxy-2-oxoglutarate aldolase
MDFAALLSDAFTLPGGLPDLRAMAAPYAHLGLRSIPLGGLTAANADSYLSDPLIAAIGGSWLAPRKAIMARDWTTIEAEAHVARHLVGSGTT